MVDINKQSYKVQSEEDSKHILLISANDFMNTNFFTIPNGSATVVPTKLTIEYILALLVRISQARKAGNQLTLAFYYSVFDKQKHSITAHISKLRNNPSASESFKAKLNFRLTYQFDKAITRNGIILSLYNIYVIKGVQINEADLQL